MQRLGDASSVSQSDTTILRVDNQSVDDMSMISKGFLNNTESIIRYFDDTNAMSEDQSLSNDNILERKRHYSNTLYIYLYS